MANRLMNARAAGLALLSAALFGVSTPLAKLALGGVGPLMLAGLLYLGAGIALAVFRTSTARRKMEARLAQSDWPWLAGAILAGGLVGPAALMLGLAQTPASTASLLLTLEGAATALIALFVFREHIGWRNGVGFVLITLGGASLAWSGAISSIGLIGPLFVVAACAAWGLDNNLTRKISAADPAFIAMWKGLVAGPANIVLALAAGEQVPLLQPALFAMTIGALGYGASLVLFIMALRELGAARTSAYFGTAPFVGAALALPLLGEPVTAILALGAVLIAIGVVIHLTESHDHAHVHEPMAHAHVHVHDAHHQHEHGPGDPPGEPHAHWHAHARLAHSHPHTPDLHHRHDHKSP